MQIYQNKTLIFFLFFFILKSLDMSKYSVSHPEAGKTHVISKFLAELSFLGNSNVQEEYCQGAVFSSMRNNTSQGEGPCTISTGMSQQFSLSERDSDGAGGPRGVSPIPGLHQRCFPCFFPACTAEEAGTQ